MMPENSFDAAFWEDHWDPEHPQEPTPVHPYVPQETQHLIPGTALDAGCGSGAEALWLKSQGWRVTAVDISEHAVSAARARECGPEREVPVDWVTADLTVWEPNRTWDVVLTSYAHADIPQLDLFRRLASWVAPGGTLLILAHQREHPSAQSSPGSHDHTHAPANAGDHGHESVGEQQHPMSATATLPEILSLFPSAEWVIDAAYEQTRAVPHRPPPSELHDVVVRVRRVLL